jgi:serine/threonine protein kinase
MVETIDLLPDFQIPYSVIFDKNIDLPSTILPRQYIDGKIYAGKAIRCSIEYGRRENGGGHGNITRVIRTPSVASPVCVKSPHAPAFSLCPEAILQLVASRALRAAGIRGGIPHVYDIFQYAGETRFSMELIDGISAIDAIIRAADPGVMLLQIIAQASLLLGFLEETIRLDHRDLKADNIWIRPVPIDYSLKVGGVTWNLKAPFQIVILDFGFACLGSEEGNAIISLSDGILPKIDPCPKEGRDIFQLIASIWSIPVIREKVGASVREEMESFLAHKSVSYVDIVHRTMHTHWIYLAVSDREFRHPPLHPATLLLKLSREWACVQLQEVAV